MIFEWDEPEVSSSQIKEAYNALQCSHALCIEEGYSLRVNKKGFEILAQRLKEQLPDEEMALIRQRADELSEMLKTVK